MVSKDLVEWAGNKKGFSKDGKYYKVYHGTRQSSISSIKQRGLEKKSNVGPRWFMVTTNPTVAKHFASVAGNQAVIEYRIPSNQVKNYLWNGVPTNFADTGDYQHALKETLPSEFIANILSPDQIKGDLRTQAGGGGSAGGAGGC